MKRERLYLFIALFGCVLCFISDNLLGYFSPSESFGVSSIFPSFSTEWAEANPIRLVLGGGLGAIALLLMFLGFYSIYLLIKAKHNILSGLFIIGAFLFSSMGPLYHCVFSFTAYLYNRLTFLKIANAEEIAETIFTPFIFAAMPAAVGFFLLQLLYLLLMQRNYFINQIY